MCTDNLQEEVQVQQQEDRLLQATIEVIHLVEVLQDQVQHQDLQAAAEVMEVALDLHEVAEDAANT